MMKVFTVDLSLCNGCYCCQIACKDEHVGNDWSPYAKPQPDTGQFWIGITEHVRGQVPHVKMTYLPKLCHHCDEAQCIDQCPAGAITKRPDGMVLLHPDRCTGCRLCVTSCPYEAIYFNEELNIAQKCTGCSHLRDSDPDEWPVPRCVDQCPTEALKFVEEEDAADFLRQAEPLLPTDSSKPRVYYQGLPRKFVAGTLYDPGTREVIIGARCRLADEETGEWHETETDDFGDFWFNDLKDNGKFSLTLTFGNDTKVLRDITTDRDISLGDIPFALSNAAAC
ncbi:MAG: 4Fe-4S dicluster domain-containing protein [Desulfopila sp.]